MSMKYPIARKVILENKNSRKKQTFNSKSKKSKKYKFHYFYRNGQRVKNKVEVEKLNKLGIPPAYKKVKIFSSNSKTLYVGVDSKGRIQQGYHPLWVEERNRKKFLDLVEFVKVYPKIKKKVNSLIPRDGKPKTKEQMVALAIGLLDICKIRPGSDRHLKFTGSYGTTTLCKKHVKNKEINNKKYVLIEFMGKSGVLNECKLKSTDKIAINIKNISKKLKKNNSFIFGKSVNGEDINKFLRENSNVPSKTLISGKTFRTYHANILFISHIFKLMDKIKIGKNGINENERKKEIVKLIKIVAKEMHHTPATFKNSYLFTPIKELFIKNPEKFMRNFKSKETISKDLSKFIIKKTGKSNIPKKWNRRLNNKKK